MSIEVTKKYLETDNNQIKVFILPEGTNLKLLFKKILMENSRRLSSFIIKRKLLYF